MDTVMTLVQPMRSAIEAKLGRCARCMRLSATLTLGSAALLALVVTAGVTQPIAFIASIPFAAFATLFVAHAVAYVVRGPAPAHCVPCAQKARARERQLRWQRRWGWLQAKRQSARVIPRSESCRKCGKPRTPEEIFKAADALPPADEALRGVVESSAVFQSLLPRLADAAPSDTWQVNMLNHFVYPLKAETNGENPTALFIARWEDDGPLSALLITPDPDGGEPHVADLRESMTTTSTHD